MDVCLIQINVTTPGTEDYRAPAIEPEAPVMKDLLAYASPANQRLHSLEYAISLASKLQAHLEGVTFSFLPEFAGLYATMPDEFFTKIQTQSERDAASAQRNFLRSAGDAKIHHGVRNYTATSADAERIFGRVARCFDLAIVPQTDPDNDAFFNPSFEDTMFLSGRPTLFVPAIHTGPAALDRILLCWNGDRWAARAAADALPLMKLARSVDVLQIELGKDGAPECPASEVIRHLKRHGIAAEPHAFTRDDHNVGAAILSFAADCGATLIVMGGYGHARAREFFFGGATREILKTMTVPVLLSH
jgi:nucleotide-binding universal stress UspA family protein